MKVGVASLAGMHLNIEHRQMAKATGVVSTSAESFNRRPKWMAGVPPKDLIGCAYVMPHDDTKYFKNHFFLTLCLLGNHEFGDIKNPTGCRVMPGDLYVVSANAKHWQFGVDALGGYDREIGTPFLGVQWVCANKSDLEKLIARLAQEPDVKFDPSVNDARYKDMVLKALAAQIPRDPANVKTSVKPELAEA